MIDRKILLEALDDARANLNKILLAVHMAENAKLSYDEERELDVIRKLERTILEFEQSRFSNWIEQKVRDINNRTKCNLLSIWQNRIQLCESESLFFFKDDYKENIERFEAEEEEIEKRIKEVVELIVFNRHIIKSACNEVVKELRNQSFVINKSSISCSFTDSNIHKGQLDMKFSYMNRENVTVHINVNQLIDPELFLKELKFKVIKEMKQRIAVDRTQSIRRAISDICSDANLKDIYFDNFDKHAAKPWDFEKGYISFDLDLSIKKIAQDFSREIIGCVRAIEALYFSKFDHITVNKDIRLGNNYYYRKIKTRELEGEQYDIYEGRVGTRKPLLFIVKDGKRIFGRQRAKLIRELGINKSE